MSWWADRWTPRGGKTSVCGFVAACLVAGLTLEASTPRLRVSDNKRFLVCEDGRPFFYLGDTAWELFHKLGVIRGPKVKAWWFNPRDGSSKQIGTYPSAGTRKFTPPQSGELLDWVLVLDEVTRKYPAPGSKYFSADR